MGLPSARRAGRYLVGPPGQVGTGEGKSMLIAVLSVFICVSTRRRVHVVGSDAKLVRRDFDSFSCLFRELAHEVGDLIWVSLGVYFLGRSGACVYVSVSVSKGLCRPGSKPGVAPSRTPADGPGDAHILAPAAMRAECEHGYSCTRTTCSWSRPLPCTPNANTVTQFEQVHAGADLGVYHAAAIGGSQLVASGMVKRGGGRHPHSFRFLRPLGGSNEVCVLRRPLLLATPPSR